MKNTKIVATVSDHRCEVDFLKQLCEAGVNVVRMNSAHLDRTGMEKIVHNLHEADGNVATLIDTKGPEIRTTVTENGTPILFSCGDELEMIGDPDGLTTHKRIYLNYKPIASVLKSGDRLLIDDGELGFTVFDINNGIIKVKAENDGELGSRKSVNVPGVAIDLPAVTERDKLILKYAVELGVDFVAHSFVRSADDVNEVRNILDALGSPMKIIAKIENQQGIDNFDEILNASYGIMIARGDLGIEVPAESVPGYQMMMIRKCIEAHKPVIVATQMLHTMIEHPRPTRAEISDVANAVYQRADALMLSGETAYGKYPIEAVRTMAKVAKEVGIEMSNLPWEYQNTHTDVSSFLARQAVHSEKSVGTDVVLTYAYTGSTARYMAAFRGPKPIFAICYEPVIARQLALSYGVIARLEPEHTDSAHRHHPVRALKSMIEEGLVRPENLAAYISGTREGAQKLEITTIADLCSD